MFKSSYSLLIITIIFHNKIHYGGCCHCCSKTDLSDWSKFRLKTPISWSEAFLIIVTSMVSLLFCFLKVILKTLPWSVSAACCSCRVSARWAGLPGLLTSMAPCWSQPPPASPASDMKLSIRYTEESTNRVPTLFKNIGHLNKRRLAWDWLRRFYECELFKCRSFQST